MIEELLSVSRTYPILVLIFASVLFMIGFKIAKKIFWVLGIVALVIAGVLFFI